MTTTRRDWGGREGERRGERLEKQKMDRTMKGMKARKKKSEQKKRKRAKKGESSSDTEEDLTPAEKKKRLKRARDAREVQGCIKWAQEDDTLSKYMDVPECGLNLAAPSTEWEIAMAATIEVYWNKVEKMGIFVPRNNNATWNKMPYRAKAAAFILCKRMKIPWNIFEFDRKAYGRLSKLRSKGMYTSMYLLFCCCQCTTLPTFCFNIRYNIRSRPPRTVPQGQSRGGQRFPQHPLA
jgi:hypothetical protein